MLNNSGSPMILMEKVHTLPFHLASVLTLSQIMFLFYSALMKKSAIKPNLTLINKLERVDEPPNLKQDLINIADLLFKNLTIKVRQFDVLKQKMITEMHAGKGVTTSFSELSVLIDGLKQLVNDRAANFGVSSSTLESHKQAWEKKTVRKKRNQLFPPLMIALTTSLFNRDPRLHVNASSLAYNHCQCMILSSCTG